MRKRLIPLTAVACVVGLGAIILYPRVVEPTYNGRPLSTWVAILGDPDPGVRQAASFAIERIVSRDLSIGPGP